MGGQVMDDAGINQKASFEFIRYASVWEDADILCEALKPSANDGRILSVCSSGDNVLALLTTNPAEIVAADLSQAQLACLDLRICAFKRLNYDALLAFLGVTSSENRSEVYRKLREDLPEYARIFWDAHPEEIENGIIHGGKFEKYLRFFGTKILPYIHSEIKRADLLKPRSHMERVDFYENKWNTFLWRLLFKVFFSRLVMGNMGRDPAFFDHVRGTVGERILSRTKHALTELPTDTNPYLTYIMTGNYSLKALPRYLRKEYKEEISNNVHKIKLICSPLQNTGMGKFDAFNLSDIFEYMDNEEFVTCYGELIDQANPHAHLAYWNMLVARSRPEEFASKVTPLAELSEVYHLRDKAWFYQAFHLDQVK